MGQDKYRTSPIKYNMNLHSRLGGKSPAQRVARTFKRLCRAKAASNLHQAGPIRVFGRSEGGGLAGCVAPTVAFGPEAAAQRRQGGSGTQRSGGTRGRSRRFSVLPGGASRGPAGRGKGGDGISLSGSCRSIRSVRSLSASTEWTRLVGTPCPACGDTVEWRASPEAAVRALDRGLTVRPCTLRSRSREGTQTADDGPSGLRARLAASDGWISLPEPRGARRARVRSVRVVPVPPGRSW